ncbi:HK97 family phage major capsid protein [Nocardioides ginsengisegetis]|uniref:HK97 family phage major capsid protein n=1 Tax=Nocardioides ginsengisegetis TaxID=661491 RepID=A0A7W3IZJ2_9ACTN|nr:phage major capsid protein [Nocardioides ginsengisegetis]MBA8803575.1 HK97 family phage major capsid protein [Nocardioides ginsengisegetis]
MSSPQLDALNARRANLQAEIDARIDEPVPANRAAAARANAEIQELVDEVKSLDARIQTTETQERRRDADAAARSRLGQDTDDQGRAPARRGFGRGADTVYGRTSGESYFRDLVAVSLNGGAMQHDAIRRLNEHAQMVERASGDLPKEFRATPLRMAAGSLEQRVNPNRTDGQGGNFVPPLWLIDEYVSLLRNGRATADLCSVRELPPGTDSINLPKVATGTTTAIQTADAAAVSSTDMTDANVSGPVRTIAGQQDFALQLLDQSPINFDEVLFRDLLADYNAQLDTQVLSGTGASGQVGGLLPMSGTNAVTYTDATPTLGELLVPIAQGMSQAIKNGKRPPTAIVMHPSIWNWALTQLDTTGRPLVDLNSNGLSSIAVLNENALSGVVGSMGGVPIVVDANLPTNLGAGTNESRIIVGAYPEAYLYEGAVRTRVLQEVLSGTLQVRVQLFNYLAFIGNRRPSAFSVVSGTGLIMPTGF